MSFLQFRFEEDPNNILPILEKRLPKSANIYNMCKGYNKFRKPDEMAFYVLHSNTNAISEKSNGKESLISKTNTWVLASYYREDYAMRYTLSAPPNAIITSEIKDAFLKCPFIDWHKQYIFTCIDFEVSPMIMEISTQIVGNSVTSMPCKIFSMSRDQVANLQLTIPDTLSSELTFKPLDIVKGAEFICSTWKYAIPKKTRLVFEKLLSKNSSMGLYDQSDRVICGMCINDCGLMGNLYTLEEHRGKGYALLVAKKLIKSFVEQEGGVVPCSAVEIKNYKSISFHQKLGMSVSHSADFIKYVPQSW